MKKTGHPPTPDKQLVLFTSQDGAVSVQAALNRETVWLTQEQMAQVFAAKRPAVTKHLRNIFQTDELGEGAGIVGPMPTSPTIWTLSSPSAIASTPNVPPSSAVPSPLNPPGYKQTEVGVICPAPPPDSGPDRLSIPRQGSPRRPCERPTARTSARSPDTRRSTRSGCNSRTFAPKAKSRPPRRSRRASPTACTILRVLQGLEAALSPSVQSAGRPVRAPLGTTIHERAGGGLTGHTADHRGLH